MQILLNKCLIENNVPKTWNNTQVILIFKKGDKMNVGVGNYRHISILPHSYKVLPKIITNRFTNKVYRENFRTIDHIQIICTLLEKCTDHNVPITLAFLDCNKAFDSVEHWVVFAAMNKSRIDSRYRNLLKNIYNNATSQIKITDYSIILEKIEVIRAGR